MLHHHSQNFLCVCLFLSKAQWCGCKEVQCMVQITWTLLIISVPVFTDSVCERKNYTSHTMFVEYASTDSLLFSLWGEWSASYPSCFTPRGKSPWYSFDKRVGGPQSWYGCGDVEKKLVLALAVKFSTESYTLLCLRLSQHHLRVLRVVPQTSFAIVIWCKQMTL